MITTRITFQVVKMKGKKSFKCTECGKRVTRQRTFEQTINPYNRLPDGTPKGRTDIYKELEVERDKWINNIELCSEECAHAAQARSLAND